ncbi:MAG: hypothetical protein KBS62_07855 [Oscillospiraceae bacterium]|nr:hypothetical protein [Candidatus Ruminococcus equi]
MSKDEQTKKHNSNYGRPLTDEHRAAISKGKKGKALSDEHKKAISKASRQSAMERHSDDKNYVSQLDDYAKYQKNWYEKNRERAMEDMRRNRSGIYSDDNKVYSVYMHQFVACGVVYRYYGVTKLDIERRKHCGYRSCPIFKEYLSIFGWTGVQTTVISEGISKGDAFDLERDLIKKAKESKSFTTLNKNL